MSSMNAADHFQPNPGTPDIGTCTKCNHGPVHFARTKDGQGSYLKNADGSYHEAFGQQFGTFICTKNKAEADYARDHKTLDGFTPGYTAPPPPTPPQTQSTRPAPSVMQEVPVPPYRTMEADECKRFYDIMWPKAWNLAGTMNVQDQKDQRIVAMAIMHDWAQVYSAVYEAERRKEVLNYTKASEMPGTAHQPQS